MTDLYPDDDGDYDSNDYKYIEEFYHPDDDGDWAYDNWKDRMYEREEE